MIVLNELQEPVEPAHRTFEVREVDDLQNLAGTGAATLEQNERAGVRVHSMPNMDRRLLRDLHGNGMPSPTSGTAFFPSQYMGSPSNETSEPNFSINDRMRVVRIAEDRSPIQQHIGGPQDAAKRTKKGEQKEKSRRRKITKQNRKDREAPEHAITGLFVPAAEGACGMPFNVGARSPVLRHEEIQLSAMANQFSPPHQASRFNERRLQPFEPVEQYDRPTSKMDIGYLVS